MDKLQSSPFKGNKSIQFHRFDDLFPQVIDQGDNQTCLSQFLPCQTLNFKETEVKQPSASTISLQSKQYIQYRTLKKPKKYSNSLEKYQTEEIKRISTIASKEDDDIDNSSLIRKESYCSQLFKICQTSEIQIKKQIKEEKIKNKKIKVSLLTNKKQLNLKNQEAIEKNTEVKEFTKLKSGTPKIFKISQNIKSKQKIQESFQITPPKQFQDIHDYSWEQYQKTLNPIQSQEIIFVYIPTITEDKNNETSIL